MIKINKRLLITLTISTVIPLSGCTKNVVESYEREFDLQIPYPATGTNPFANAFSENCTTNYTYNDKLGVEMGDLKEGITDHWTTTAYLPADLPEQRNLYVMYLSTTGKSLKTTYENRTKDHSLVKSIPAGNLKVLTVLVTHADTTDTNTITYLENAQSTINQQHSDYAAAQGWQPIVEFTFTNQTISHAGLNISIDTTATDAIAKLQQKGINSSDYDYLILLNIDPSKVEGGMAWVNYSYPFYVYIGNYSNWTTALSQANLLTISDTAYHHEIGHHWGWQHDWSPCSNDTPFITLPELFGWTDTDGDNIPEIIDPTPYGTTP